MLYDMLLILQEMRKVRGGVGLAKLASMVGISRHKTKKYLLDMQSVGAVERRANLWIVGDLGEGIAQADMGVSQGYEITWREKGKA